MERPSKQIRHILPREALLYIAILFYFISQEYLSYIRVNFPETPLAYFNIIINLSVTMSEFNWKGIFISTNKLFLKLGSLVLFVEIILFFARVRIDKRKRYKNAIKDVAEFEELAHETGVIAFYKTEKASEKKESIEFLIQQIKHSNSTKILGATGYSTFASSMAFLHGTVLKFEGSMQILLLNPGIEDVSILSDFRKENEWDEFKKLLKIDSRGEIAKRSVDLSMTPEDYAKEIFKSIIFLKELKEKGRFIELRLYKGPLIWKMIISGDYLWLQHYPPGIHVNDAPVFGILKTNPDTTLLNGFDVLFSRLWHSPLTLHYPL